MGGQYIIGECGDDRRQDKCVLPREVIVIAIHKRVTDDCRTAASGAEQLGHVGVVPAARFSRSAFGRDTGIAQRRRSERVTRCCVIEVPR